MIEPEPQNESEWMKTGLLHLQHFDYAEALHCFRQTLMLNSALPEGWLNYGSVLEKLGCYGAAIAANSNAQQLFANPYLKLDPPAAEPTDAIAAALSLKESSADYWLNRGHALCDEGDYEAAITNYEKALQIRPNDAQAWFGHGNMSAALGQFEVAITSYDNAIELQPNDYQCWNNRGYALHRLGRYEAAIASYDNTITHNPGCYPAWNNRGYALSYLGQHEAAIIAYEQALALNPNYPEAWNNRGHALKALGQFEDAIASYDHAIALKPDFLEAQRSREQTQEALLQAQIVPPRPILFTEHDLQPSTIEAYPFEDFPEQHLEVLLALSIKLCRQAQFSEAEPFIEQGLEKIDLLLQPSDLQTKLHPSLIAQRTQFQQLQVDLLVPQDPVAALEQAEAVKTDYLNQVLDWTPTTPNISYAQLQGCLSDRTVAIYWHFSPANLHTFLLRHDQPPQVVSSIHQGQRLEAWIQQWQKDYQDGYGLPPEIANTGAWRQTMSYRLEELSTILEIDPICQQYFEDIDQVILIPYGSMHLLPLHILFPETLETTYLPSAQWVDLSQQHPAVPLQRCLTVEAGNVLLQDEKYPSQTLAKLTSTALTQQYGKLKSLTLPPAEATHSRILAALPIMSDCLYIAGHCHQSMDEPSQSVLKLSQTETLGLRAIAKLNLSHYGVVCLPSCEWDVMGQGLEPTVTSQERVPIACSVLAAGAGAVISTLWPTDELPKTVFMLEFHRWLHQGYAPATALAKAQQWLRTATHYDLIQWGYTQAASLTDTDLSEDLLSELRIRLAHIKKDGGERYPYGNPYYWAGFTVTGRFPFPAPPPLNMQRLQALLEAIATHQATTPLEPTATLGLQVDLDQMSRQIQRFIQKYPSLQKHYEAILQKQQKQRPL
jgi:tetratricopeptide (TPR) repeat protein/CHAT domain-containing protein